MADDPAQKGQGVRFNPWTASFEEALRAEEALPRMGEREPGQMTTEASICYLSRPLDQHLVAQKINMERAEHSHSENQHVLEWIAQCFQHSLDPPPWLKILFVETVGSVKFGLHPTWDTAAAFGRPHPKGKSPAKVKQEIVLGSRIHRIVEALLFEDHPKGDKDRLGRTKPIPVDKEFWSRIGEEVGKSHQAAADLYRSHILRVGAIDWIEQRKNRGWPYFLADGSGGKIRAQNPRNLKKGLGSTGP